MAACCSQCLMLCSLGLLVLTVMMWFSSRTGWHQRARLLDCHRRALFSPQVQQRVARSAQAQSTVSMPVQTNLSLTMPFYNNPMMLSQTNTRSLQDANQRHIDDEFTQDGQLRWALHAGKQKYPSTGVLPNASVYWFPNFPQDAPQPANADSGPHQQRHLTAFPVQHGNLSKHVGTPCR